MGRTYTLDHWKRFLVRWSLSSQQIVEQEQEAFSSISSLQKNLDLSPDPTERQYVARLLSLLASDRSPLQLPHLAFSLILPEEITWTQRPQPTRQHPLVQEFSSTYRTDLQHPIELKATADFFPEYKRIMLHVLFLPQVFQELEESQNLLAEYLYRPLYSLALNLDEDGKFTLHDLPLHRGQPYRAEKKKNDDPDPTPTLHPYWTVSETQLPTPKKPQKAPRPRALPLRTLVPAMR